MLYWANSKSASMKHFYVLCMAYLFFFLYVNSHSKVDYSLFWALYGPKNCLHSETGPFCLLNANHQLCNFSCFSLNCCLQKVSASVGSIQIWGVGNPLSGNFHIRSTYPITRIQYMAHQKCGNLARVYYAVGRQFFIVAFSMNFCIFGICSLSLPLTLRHTIISFVAGRQIRNFINLGPNIFAWTNAKSPKDWRHDKLIWLFVDLVLGLLAYDNMAFFGSQQHTWILAWVHFWPKFDVYWCPWGVMEEFRRFSNLIGGCSNLYRPVLANLSLGSLNWWVPETVLIHGCCWLYVDFWALINVSSA